MTKPPLGKVEALLYVLQHVTTKGCARIMTHPPNLSNFDRRSTLLNKREWVCNNAVMAENEGES